MKTQQNYEGIDFLEGAYTGELTRLKKDLKNNSLGLTTVIGGIECLDAQKNKQIIDAIDKEEKNFVLKLSYIISKEMSFQQYKNINQGKDLSSESATYGNDICFPGDQLVTMQDGSVKVLSDIRAGDVVSTIDPATKEISSVRVEKLVVHEAKNYALTSLLLIKSEENITSDGLDVILYSKVVEATPNHPMTTSSGEKKMGLVEIGEKILCKDAGNSYEFFTVLDKKEFTKGSVPVYNMEASGGSTFLMNSVVVRQK